MLYRFTLAALIVSASAFGPNPGSCKADCDDNLGPCKRQCTEDYPPTLAEWNAMCEAGNGVFGTMPSVEKCKERGALEYSCGSDGPCTQSPTGNCKGRCEDAVRLAARRAPPVGEQLGCDDDGEAQSQRHGRDGSLGKRDGRVARHGPLRDLLHLGNLEAWTRGLDTVIAKCRIATGSTRAQKRACRTRAEGVAATGAVVGGSHRASPTQPTARKAPR